MKKILFLLLLPLSAFAQRETKTDTTYLINESGKWFSARRVVYINNEETFAKVLIGDTSRLVQSQIERITSTAKSMAQDAQTVSNFKRQLAGLTRESDAIKTASGVSPLDTVQKRNVAKFLVPGWTIRQSGAITDIAFLVNAQGRFRYTITGQQTRNADLFGDVMVLNAYQTQGNQVELYRNSEGNYMSLDRSVVVREPGSQANLQGSKNRAGAAPTIEAIPAPVKETPKQAPKKKKRKSPRI